MCRCTGSRNARTSTPTTTTTDTCRCTCSVGRACRPAYCGRVGAIRPASAAASVRSGSRVTGRRPVDVHPVLGPRLDPNKARNPSRGRGSDAQVALIRACQSHTGSRKAGKLRTHCSADGHLPSSTAPVKDPA
jgi:hypothetical protein